MRARNYKQPVEGVFDLSARPLKSAVLDLCLDWENSTLGKWISILVVEATQSVVVRCRVDLRLLNLFIDPSRCTGTSTPVSRYNHHENSPPPQSEDSQLSADSLCTCDASEFPMRSRENALGSIPEYYEYILRRSTHARLSLYNLRISKPRARALISEICIRSLNDVFRY